MNSTVPVLDNIDFEGLVELARAQIPRYAPQWTDHNLHDPGMTLVDLLAWIVDQQIYRVGLVSDRHLEAFASLLGKRPQPPVAATGLIWPHGPPANGRFLHSGTEVRCIRHPEIKFALRDDVYVGQAQLESVDLIAGGERLALELDERSSGSVPLVAGSSGEQSALSMVFNEPLVEAEIGGLVSLGFDVATPPGGAPDAEHAWGPLRVTYRIGAAEWTPIEVASDTTRGLATTGAIRLQVPGGMGPGGMGPGGIGPGSELRIALDSGFFPVAPQLRFVRLNVLEVAQHELVRAGLLAEGTGRVDQVIPFDSDDIVPIAGDDGLEISVVEAPWTDPAAPWSERAQLETSCPDDRHYVRHPDQLVFGNGINGQRPPRDSHINHGGFARTKGAAGNLRAGLAWTVPALDDDGRPFGTNPVALTGGADAWNLDKLAAEARQAATSRKVLLTDQDLQERALRLAGLGIARAEVVPRFDPRLPDRAINDVRTLIVFPHREHGTPIQPVSNEYVNVVQARLESDRLLGERLIVQGPQIVSVDIDMRVIVEPGALPAAVRDAVSARIRQRVSDITIVNDVEPWPLGRVLSVEEIKSIAANVAGVVAVPRCGISRAGAAMGDDPIAVPVDGVASAATVTVHSEPSGSVTDAGEQ